jgi:hypothetical protein
MRVATHLVAQVMTRGKVKSKLITERKWVIRSQPPYSGQQAAGVCSSSTKCWLALIIRSCLSRLRYSQPSFERVQDNKSIWAVKPARILLSVKWVVITT